MKRDELTPAVVRGASGAEIFYNHNRGTVVKMATKDPHRVVGQAMLMRKVGPRYFPSVYRIGDNWYEMEWLAELQTLRSDIINEMHYMLTRIWSRVYRVEAGKLLGIEHEEYVADRAGDHRDEMLKWLGIVRSYEVACVDQIHGDPTLDNLMERRGGGLCFIDPLPATPKMPALKAVDYGKMLQSCWGYEMLKGNHVHFRGNARDVSQRVLKMLDPVEADIACYFLCVHILRLIPYQPEHEQDLFWMMYRNAYNEYGPK